VEQLVDAGANFFVVDKFVMVELTKPRLDLLTELCVMVNVMFDKLPNVFFRAAVIFCCDAGQLCLEFGAEIYFHKASLGAEVAGVKSPQ
jgi:hypothetical protein